MSNGFKKAVGLLVSASLLASLAATAFAGTAAAAITPNGVTQNVPGNAAYTPLATNPTIVLDGIDDILAPYTGANLRIVVGNGFQLNPDSMITVSRDSGPLTFGDSLPGSVSIHVWADATGNYFDVPIAHSSGDLFTIPSPTTVTFQGIQVRQSGPSLGDTATIDHNSTNPGDAVAAPFTLATLTGTVGDSTFHIDVNPSSYSADAVDPQAVATAVSDNTDWAGNPGAAPVTQVTSWTTECGTIVATGNMTADISGCHTAGTWDVSATSVLPVAGYVGVGSFTVYPGVLAVVKNGIYDGSGDRDDFSNYLTSGNIPVGETRQFVAFEFDAWGNFLCRTADNGDRSGCFGEWSDTPHPGAAEINYTGLLSAQPPGPRGLPSSTPSAGPSPARPARGTSSRARPTDWLGTANLLSSTQAAPIVRAGPYGTTTASYSYSEPEWLWPTWNLPHINGALLFPGSGFIWTIDIADQQGNRRVHFDTSSVTVDGPASLDLSASFLNDYTLQVVGGLQQPAPDRAALGHRPEGQGRRERRPRPDHDVLRPRHQPVHLRWERRRHLRPALRR